MIYAQTRYLPAGDRALSVEFGDEVSPLLAERVRAFVAALDSDALPGVRSVLPTYRSVLIFYDPSEAGGYSALLERLMRVEHRLSTAALPAARVVELPVLYGGEAGPDLTAVAAHCSLSPREVVRRHSEREYLVYMLGFTPGFPYLGGLDPALTTPRLKEPRVKIPAGSVGIAGAQTGVYPIDSPGGWQLIGKTPLRLFDLSRSEPFLLAPGDRLRFRPIDAQEYAVLEKEVRADAES